jgi:23S rRNA pseudouridine1911/1915/1917 synthase
MALVSIPRGGRNALTYFRTVENFARHTLIECKIVTGRTHQIRVHLASISIPVTGDTVYGRPEPTIAVGRQFLHAAHLAFRRPDGEEMVCESPLPADLQDAMNQARH